MSVICTRESVCICTDRNKGGTADFSSLAHSILIRMCAGDFVYSREGKGRLVDVHFLHIAAGYLNERSCEAGSTAPDQ